jgi:hypothetical protein
VSLTGVIGSFKTGTYTVKTSAAGSHVNGRWVEGAETSSTLDAAVVPVDGDTLRQLPEAYHDKSVYTLFTTSSMSPQGRTAKGDRIVIDGVDHTIVKLRVWTAFGITFYDGVAAAEPK